MFRYLYTVLLYMPDYKNESEDIEQLLPWSEFIREHCTGLIGVDGVKTVRYSSVTVITLI